MRTVHPHVEAHIPRGNLGPAPPRLEAADLSDTHDWDPKLIESLRKKWAWIHGVPKFPEAEKLSYLALLEDLQIPAEQLKAARADIKKQKTVVAENVSKATDLLHQADLAFKAVEALSGGPEMAEDDKNSLAIMGRLNAFEAERLLTAPARMVAKKIQEHTLFPVPKQELLSLVMQTTPYNDQNVADMKDEIARQQKFIEGSAKALNAMKSLKEQPPLGSRPGQGEAALRLVKEICRRVQSSEKIAGRGKHESNARDGTRKKVEADNHLSREPTPKGEGEKEATAAAGAPTTSSEETKAHVVAWAAGAVATLGYAQWMLRHGEQLIRQLEANDRQLAKQLDSRSTSRSTMEDARDAIARRMAQQTVLQRQRSSTADRQPRNGDSGARDVAKGAGSGLSDIFGSSSSDSDIFNCHGGSEQEQDDRRCTLYESDEVGKSDAQQQVSEVAGAGRSRLSTTRNSSAVSKDCSELEDPYAGGESSDSDEDAGADGSTGVRRGARLTRGGGKGKRRSSEWKMARRVKKQQTMLSYMGNGANAGRKKRRIVESDDDADSEESSAGSPRHQINLGNKGGKARGEAASAARAGATATPGDGPGDLQPVLHHPQVGRRAQAPLAQPEGLECQLSSVAEQAQAGGSEATPRSDKTWRQVYRLGLSRCVSPSADTASVPTHDENKRVDAASSLEQMGGEKTSESHVGSGISMQPRADDKNDSRPPKGMEVSRNQVLHQDRRPYSSSLVDQGGLVSGIRNDKTAHRTRGGLIRREMRIWDVDQNEVVRHGVLLSGAGDVPARREGGKVGGDDERAEEKVTMPGRAHHTEGDTEGDRYSDLGDGRGSGGETDGVGGTRPEEMDNVTNKYELGPNADGQRAAERQSVSSDSGSAFVDAQLRRGQQSGHSMERQAGVLRPTRGSNLHGRLLESRRCVGGGDEEVPGNRHELPSGWRGNPRAYHVSGNRSSGRWIGSHVSGTRLQNVHGGDEDRRHSGHKIHEVFGRQEAGSGKKSLGQRQRNKAQTSVCGVQQRLRNVARAGQEKSSRQAESQECGLLGVADEQGSVRGARPKMGPVRSGCVRGSMELPITSVSMPTEVGQAGIGVRCTVASVSSRERSSVGVSAATQRSDHALPQNHRELRSHGSSNHADGTKHAGGSSNKDGGTIAGVDALLVDLVGRAGGILSACRKGGISGLERGEAVVDQEDLEQSDWRDFVRRRLEARGASKKLAEAAELTFKPNANGKRGAHLDRAYSRFLAYIRAEIGEDDTRLPMVVTDVVLGNIVAELAVSQSDAECMLSGLRVVFGKAYGPAVAALAYDKGVTNAVRALGKQLKVKQPKYTKAVDLQSTLQAVAADREIAKRRTNQTAGKARLLRNSALFLLRLHSLSRTDDMAKFNALSRSGMQVYSGLDGSLILREHRSEELEECVRTEGHISIRFFKPKGSEFAVRNWSTDVEVHTVRPGVVVDAGAHGTWLDEQTAANLCAVRAMRDYFRCLEEQNLVSKIRATEEGGFWSMVKPDAFGGSLQPLQKGTLRNLVMSYAEKGGLKMNKNEEDKSPEKEKLSAHFLRGHAGSLAYTLHVKESAVWSAALHLDRARHTDVAFHNNYSRGIVERIRQAFRNHKRKTELRFEEALIL